MNDGQLRPNLHSLESFYMLILLLMPVGFTGIGLVGVTELLANISLADVPFVVLLACMVICWKRLIPQTEIARSAESSFLMFALPFMALVLLSTWNLLRFDGSIRTSFLSEFKLFVCLLYAFAALLFLRQCSQRAWERFVTVAAMAGFIFSLTCLIGVLCFFLKISCPFVADYRTSFRATGLQEDPNLAAIFLLMSISYVLMWMTFTKKRVFKVLVLCSVLLGAISTVSKACIITLIVTAVVMLILSFASNMRQHSRNILVMIAMGAVFAVLLATQTTVLDSLLSRLDVMLSGDTTSALTGRNIGWGSALKVLWKSPLNLLFGVGIGNFECAAKEYGLVTISYSVHNTLLSMLVEGGVLLLLLVLVMLLRVLVKLVCNIFKYRDLFSLYSAWGIISIFIFMNSLNFQNNRMAYTFIVFVYISSIRIRAREIKFNGVIENYGD